MEDTELEKLDAYIQVAALGAYADGVLADEERLVLRTCVATHAPSEETARLMFAFVERLPSRLRPLRKSERAQRVSEIRSVLTDARDRERAFVLAVDVADAHGGIGVRESSVLLQLVFDLEIDGDFARRVVEETSRKARGRPVQTATQPDVEVTLRSPEHHDADNGRLAATLRSPEDDAREFRARATMTLPSDSGLEEGAPTERRRPSFADSTEFTDTLRDPEPNSWEEPPSSDAQPSVSSSVPDSPRP